MKRFAKTPTLKTGKNFSKKLNLRVIIQVKKMFVFNQTNIKVIKSN